MTIAKKLYALILTALLGLLALTGLSMYQLDKVNTAASYTTVNTVPSLLALDDARSGFAAVRLALWRYLGTTDPAMRNRFEKSMTDAHTIVIDALNKYEKEDISDDADRSMLQADRQSFAAYEKVRENAIAIVASGKLEEAKKNLLLQQSLVDKATKDFEDHKEYNVKLGKQGEETAAATICGGQVISDTTISSRPAIFCS